jgi:hypothetical protein
MSGDMGVNSTIWLLIFFGGAGWLVAAVALSLLIGGMTKVRDRQVPREELDD